MKRLVLVIFTLLMAGCVSTSSSQNSSNGPKKGQSLLILENKAEAAYVGGHLDIAEGYYRALLKAKATYSPAWFRLGNIYTRTNRLNAAVSAYQRCIQLDNHHEKAWHNLAVARMRQATDVLLSAQEQISDDTPMGRQLAQLLTRLMSLQSSPPDRKSTAMVEQDVSQ